MPTTRMPSERPIEPGRAARLLVLLLLPLLVVGGKSIWLGSVGNPPLTRYAHSQQQNTQVLPAVRGDILDRNGQELAVGEEAVTFYATPGLLGDPVATALRVADLLELTANQQDALVTRLSQAEGGFVYVARQVPRADAVALKEAAIEGIGWYDEERRMYPQGHVAGQIVGTVDIDNTGIEGIELLYDRSLRGAPGTQVVVRDPTGTPIDVLQLQREVDGRDVQLTIDATLQTETERIVRQTVQRTAAIRGTAVVMNPRNGEILALASVPTVHPGQWGQAPPEATKMRAITGTYEPGSTFKVVAIGAALEEGLVTPQTSYRLPPTVRVCDEKTNCVIEEAYRKHTKVMSVHDIMVESSNVGTIKIGREVLGGARFDQWIRRFGFMEPTGIDFPGEVRGLMLPREQWSDATMGNLPIGQGISVTPIQLATAYAAIANDGVAVQPHLLRRIGSEPPVEYPSRRVVSPATARTLRDMLSGVVNEEEGTGKLAQIEGYSVGGKTGTSNIAEGGIYVKGRHIASFAGMVPTRNPQLVVLVVIDEPAQSYGGVVAAPAFREITEFALTYLAIPDDGML
jgi:cell division protein FtsI (penicillin-binding protein 3)